MPDSRRAILSGMKPNHKKYDRTGRPRQVSAEMMPSRMA